MTLTALDQVRVLADPLRLRIVEQFCRAEFTTKQVAQTLGESPTKLYRHVDALERVGLIRQVRTRRNRGTLERYHQAVARAFRADTSLFGGGAARPETETLRSMVSTIFETTARELSELTARGEVPGEGASDTGVLSFVRVETDAATIARFTRRLQKLLADVRALDEAKPGAAASRAYRLTLTFHPLDSTDPTG